MKSLTNVFSILAILGAIASGVFFLLNTKDKNQLQLNIQSYETQLAAERATIRKQNEKLETNAAQLDQTSKNLEEARSNITVITARSNQLKRDNQRFTDELERRLEKESLQRALADLKKEMAKLRATTISLEKAKTYEQTIASLESEILRLKSVQSTAASVVQNTLPAGAKLAPADLNGVVLTVGAQSSFVITNLGYTNGIRLDHLLNIERNGEIIAQLQVTEVKENLSIARILPESFKTDPKPGDSVVSGNR
jgi:myosin heavy subunit